MKSQSSASSSSSTSTSDSDSDSNSNDSGSDSEDEEEEATAATLKALLLKAKTAAKAKAHLAATADSLADQDEVVLFSRDEAVLDPAKAIHKNASATLSKLAKPAHVQAPTSLTLSQDLSGMVAGGSGSSGAEGSWGRTPLPSLSKAQQKARHPRTAGPKWFDLPAPTMTPSLKREIQAMRMRNSLDPKRFYRGEAKSTRATLPEFFAFGHVVDSGTSARNVKESVGKKRSFVEELVEDEKAQAYTKRKTKEVMERGMSGRKGKKWNK